MVEIEKIAENMLFQYYNISDKLFNSIYNYFYSVYYADYIHTTDFSIFTALYSNDFNELEKGNIRRKLINEVLANPWINSIYIYNKRAEAVFSNISSAQSVSDFFDQGIIPIINERRSLIDPIYIPRIVKYTIDGRKYQFSTLTILYAEYASSGFPEAAMAVNIDLQELQNVFIANNDKSQMFIIDKNGIVISHSDSSLVNINMSEDDYIDKILKNPENKSSFTIKINGKECLVNYLKSNRSMGWIFVRVDDMNELMYNLYKVQRNVLLLTVIFVLTGVCIAIYFIMRIYVPLDKRLKNFSIFAAKFQPIRKNYLIKHLLEGNINKNELEDLKLLSIDIKAKQFIVLLISFDSYSKLNEQNPAETLILYRRSITKTALNILNEILDNTSSVETYDNDDHVCLILSFYDDSIETSRKIEKSALDILMYINNNFYFKITMAMSNKFQNIRDTGKIYKETLSFLNYKIILGCGHLITGSTISGLKFEPYKYPLKKEKQLVEAIKLCNIIKVEKLLDEILSIVRHFTYDEIMLSLTQLATGTIREMEIIIDFQDLNINFEYLNIFKNIGKYDSIAELREWYMIMYSRIIEILNAKKDTKKEAIVEKLEEYIGINYANPNLSIDLISDYIGLSANYVRYIYKEVKNYSLSNLINDIRLGKARELLLTTNTPINKIPELIGFSSKSYFFENFKKHTGKTPDQFRREK